MVKVDFMIDCLQCGAQMWHLDHKDREEIKIKCGDCGDTDTIVLTDELNGASCIMCDYDTWSIIEHLEDEHIIIECENDLCGEHAEIWLQGDELEAQKEK